MSGILAGDQKGREKKRKKEEEKRRKDPKYLFAFIGFWHEMGGPDRSRGGGHPHMTSAVGGGIWGYHKEQTRESTKFGRRMHHGKWRDTKQQLF